MVKRIIIFGIVFLILGSFITFANSPPKLMEGHAEPAVAAPDTLIVYQVMYIDEDGDAPEYVIIIFTGVESKEMRNISMRFHILLATGAKKMFTE